MENRIEYVCRSLYANKKCKMKNQNVWSSVPMNGKLCNEIPLRKLHFNHEVEANCLVFQLFHFLPQPQRCFSWQLCDGIRTLSVSDVGTPARSTGR